MNNNNITIGTIARTVVLIIALVNQTLTMTGYNPIPYSDDEIYIAVTGILTVCASLVAWWKNNSFTQKAIYTDSILHDKV